jgi:peptidoglycan/xylan/chitin deacetylase (PgdA/CDA1 family)
VAIPPGSSPAGHTITTWPKNRKGAVSLTFDDGDPSNYTAGVPELEARGMKASFYIITRLRQCATSGIPLGRLERRRRRRP